MTNKAPQWLPSIIELNEFDGNWNDYIDNLYTIFKKDFITSRPKLNGKPVICDGRDCDGKCEGFWHITSETDKTTGARLPSLRRCERVPWAKPTIINSKDPLVSVWENIRKRKINVLIFIESCSYLIVLVKRKNVFILATSYFVDKPHTKEKLIKERKAYINSINTP